MRKGYMAHTVKETLAVEIMGKTKQLPLSDVADGCIGVSLWFDTYDNAAKWAGKSTKIGEANLATQTNRKEQL